MFAEKLYRINERFCQDVPSLVKTQDFTRDLVHFLFPIKADKNLSLEQIKENLFSLQWRFRELLNHSKEKLPGDVDELANQFFLELPGVYEDLLDEADAYLKHDPAAGSVEEVILCYPGFFAILVYRVAHLIYNQKIPVLPRIMTEYAHSNTGIDIHPGAIIGRNFFIDHGTGVVIGETTLIGDNVKIYQGVTLGALHVEKELANKKRHPTIEDNVIIYAGSTILGGETVVGHDTVIGGNVWLTSSVAPYTVVYRQPKIIYKDAKNFNEPINFVI